MPALGAMAMKRHHFFVLVVLENGMLKFDAAGNERCISGKSLGSTRTMMSS